MWRNTFGPHVDERRQVQLKHIVEELIPKDIESEKYDIILLGDLNALTRSDYDDEDWKRIEDTAEKMDGLLQNLIWI